MKWLKKLARQLEYKPKNEVIKFVILTLFVSILAGFSSGLAFREVRLNVLSLQKRAQTIEENKRLNNLFQEFLGPKPVTNNPKK